MSSLDEIKQMFFLECDELLEALNDGLADIEARLPTTQGCDSEIINAVFRNVHSIKGGAASFGLDAIVRFSHSFETVLDKMRSGQLAPDAESMRVLQRSADHLADLVAAGRAGDGSEGPLNDALLAQLARLAEGQGPADSGGIDHPGASGAGEDAPIGADELLQNADAEDLTFAPLALASDPLDLPSPSRTRFSIEVCPTAELFANGHEPLYLFRELAALGDLVVTADAGALPAFADLSAKRPYLRWRLDLLTERSEDDIREIFEFVETLAEIRIEADPAESRSEPEAGPDGSGPDGAEIDECSAAQASSGDIGADQESTTAVPPVAIANDETLGSTSRPQSAVADTAYRAQETPAVGSLGDAKGGAKSPKSTVRVDLDLVDSLINIVGELVINQSVLTQSVSESHVANRADLGASLDEYKSLALQIQENVMSLRAQSVKQLFQRMARIVRETSEVAGKDVHFETEGEDTEIDKTVIERLIEPLTHILRNAIDHGLEATEARRGAGKSPAGTVRLSAWHRSGRVLIEVADDGAGIDRRRVFDIAAGKGLVAPDAQLSDGEIDRLLFLPGFSTKDQVTDLSGRGVGMDVVQSAIRKLGGRVSITSTPGRGTTFAISLPLTLAVLDGMVVDVAGQTMVVPITSVVETIRPDGEHVHRMGASAEVLNVRDSLVPIVDLGRAFRYRATGLGLTDLVLLLVETEQGERWALAVDRIIDQRQVVIKSLEGNYGHVPGVAAATILGDGKIALIIDPEETARIAERELAPPSPLVTANGD